MSQDATRARGYEKEQRRDRGVGTAGSNQHEDPHEPAADHHKSQEHLHGAARDPNRIPLRPASSDLTVEITRRGAERDADRLPQRERWDRSVRHR